MRRRRIYQLLSAFAVSLLLHALFTRELGERLGHTLDSISRETEAIRVNPPATAPPPSPERLRFDSPITPQMPKSLVTDRVQAVPPPMSVASLLARRGGGETGPNTKPDPLLRQDPGIGSGFGLGLDEVDGRFAQYIDQLRQTGLDVVFVIDATGSMEWVLAQVKERIFDVADAVRILVPATRFGAVAYRDRSDPEFVVRHQELTFSMAKLARFLDTLDASGGGDLGEALLAGLRRAIEASGWSSGGKRLVIVIGDAPPYADEVETTLDLAARFRAAGGELTTVDVSDDANPLLLAARVGRSVNPALYRNAPSHEFERLAERGGGTAATLGDDLQLARRLVGLIFGERHAPLLRALLDSSRIDAPGS